MELLLTMMGRSEINLPVDDKQLSQWKEVTDEQRNLPCAVPLTPQLGAQHSGRGAPEQGRQGTFKAYSAGVEPPTRVDPIVIELLQSARLPTEVKSKHFREFANSGAQELDFVFTLSDTAAGERMPEWPGLPVTAHWNSPDPVLAEGQDWERKQA
jgi:protein-tyrosine-phosphatase